MLTQAAELYLAWGCAIFQKYRKLPNDSVGTRYSQIGQNLIKFAFLWTILIYKMLACVSLCVSVHADFSGMLSLFWDFEVLLELAWQGDAVFWISRTPLHNFTQYWQFQPFLGQFQDVGYQNACTWAEKFIGNTFTQFHACLHTISSKFHEIFT